jgi:hypothetical protein
MLKKLFDGVVEFFGSLLGVPSVLKRPIHDFTGRAPTIDELRGKW